MSSSSSKGRKCHICAGPTNGVWHYGVVSCRACASFFHRSVKENRQYSCRYQHHCYINNDNGLRNSCRACRMKKCLSVGMAIDQQNRRREKESELQQLPLFRQSPGDSSTSSPQEQHTVSSIISASYDWPLNGVPVFNNEDLLESKIPLTMQFEQVLRQFANGHRALSIVEGINTDFTGIDGKSHQQLKLLNYEEFQRTEKSTILLVFSMIQDYFPPINELPKENKLKLLRYFGKQFTLVNKAEMTIKIFPEPDSPYAVLLPGGIVDRNGFEYMLINIVEDAEKRKNLSKSFCQRHFDFIRGRYYPLNITPLEYSAMVALLFWNTVKFTASEFIDPEIYTSKRNALYIELSTIIEANRQANNTEAMAIRFGNLLDLLHQMAFFTCELMEVSAMAKIFMDVPDFWDDIKLPC